MHRIRPSLFYFGVILYLEANPCIIRLILETKNKQTKNSQFFSSLTAPKFCDEYAGFELFLLRSITVDII